MVFPMNFGLLFAAAMLISSIGFKNYVWFISLGYGFSIAAQGVALLLLYGYQAQGELDGDDILPFNAAAAMDTIQDFAKSKPFFVWLPFAINHFTAINAIFILSWMCFFQFLKY